MRQDRKSRKYTPEEEQSYQTYLEQTQTVADDLSAMHSAQSTYAKLSKEMLKQFAEQADEATTKYIDTIFESKISELSRSILSGNRRVFSLDQMTQEIAAKDVDLATALFDKVSKSGLENAYKAIAATALNPRRSSRFNAVRYPNNNQMQSLERGVWLEDVLPAWGKQEGYTTPAVLTQMG